MPKLQKRKDIRNPNVETRYLAHLMIKWQISYLSPAAQAVQDWSIGNHEVKPGRVSESNIAMRATWLCKWLMFCSGDAAILQWCVMINVSDARGLCQETDSIDLPVDSIVQQRTRATGRSLLTVRDWLPSWPNLRQLTYLWVSRSRHSLWITGWYGSSCFGPSLEVKRRQFCWSAWTVAINWVTVTLHFSYRKFKEQTCFLCCGLPVLGFF